MIYLQVKNVQIYGMSTAMSYAKLPMMNPTELDDYLRDSIRMEGEYLEGEEKRNSRMTNLSSVAIGTGHDTVLQGIVVQFVVDFTIKAWTEAQRYHFLDFISSCSTMHALQKIDVELAYIEYVDSRIIEIMKELIQKYNQTKDIKDFLVMAYSNPCGMKLSAAMTTNYRQLKTIYWQRKNHKLPEWREFCKWISTLPHFKEWCIDSYKGDKG